MLKSVIILSLYFVAIHATGELSIWYNPTSLAFKGDDKLDSYNLGNVLAASLGYSTDVASNGNWNGLFINDPFGVPKKAVVFLVTGVDHLPAKNNAKTYEMYGNSAEESVHIFFATAQAADKNIFNVDLDQNTEKLKEYNDVFGKKIVPDFPRKTDLPPEHLHFYKQLEIIYSLTDGASHLPNFVFVRISLSPLTLIYGEDSPEITEALKLLSDAVGAVYDSTKLSFDNDFLFVVATTKDNIYKRNKRQSLDAANSTSSDLPQLAQSEDYSPDYPVIFNIILWFGVTFVFTLLAICYAIADMDPGRDSIIYRMTSTRMKKDN